MSAELPPALAKDMSLLLPNSSVDLKKWAVVACDQFTSQPEYWANADSIVGDAPSTLRIIYPEVYLGEDAEKKAKRIEDIQKEMKKYLADGVLTAAEWPIYVERTVLGRVHHGLVICVDLEKYEFVRNAKTLIRPTEETIVERLPPRMEIRRGAPLESPHILLLIDDDKKTVIEPLQKLAEEKKLRTVYSTDLMLDGGKIEGFALEPEQRDAVFAALKGLINPEEQRRKYGESAVEHPLLFAVGDGNHSLATAKSIWEEQKKKGADPETCPARYALVELNNVHDEALVFEPIHRVFDGELAESVLDEMQKAFGSRMTVEEKSAEETVKIVLAHGNNTPHKFGWISPKKCAVVTITETDKTLVVATIQPTIDTIVKGNVGKIGIDYVHGEDVVCDLATKEKHSGIILPAMQKSDLFLSVVKMGLVPRKTFSMGHAQEKRYYMECRKIL